MKTKKKMMSLLLAVCMVLTLMPATALAEETELSLIHISEPTRP